MVGGWREVGPPDSEWDQTLRAAPVCPWDAPGTAAHKNDLPKALVPKPPSGKEPKRGCAIAFVRGWGEVGPPDSEWGQTLRAAVVCPRDAPVTSAPKNERPKAPVPKPPAENLTNGGWAIALVGGWGEVGPPDSEWGQTLRAASLCPRDTPGTAAPKNECPKAPVPKLPSGKGPKRGVGYSLGGGVGLSWSAGLEMGPNFASGLRVPAGCPGQSRAQKRPPEGPRPTTPHRKMPKTRGGL